MKLKNMNKRGFIEFDSISPGVAILTVLGLFTGFIVANSMGAGLFLKILSALVSAAAGFIISYMMSDS